MAVASVDQSLALQQEMVRPELEDLSLESSILWKKFKSTQTKSVSSRLARIPTMPTRGGKPRVGNLDGGDLGLGSGPITIPGQVTTTTLVMAWSYTREAEYATDSDEKAIEDFATLTKSIAPKAFADFMDTVIQGNGSNTLDTIVGTVTQGANIVGFLVNNANFFLDDQDLDVWSALGVAGGPTASVTVESSDILNNTIWLSNPIPTSSGIGAGYLLLVSGSPGAANTGVFGLRYYQVGTNTGNWLGIQRSAYPGKYLVPTIPVNGALTPQIVRAIFSLIELSKGEEAVDGEGMFGHCNVDVRDAWEQNALLVQRIDYTNLKGDTSEDMLKRKAATTIAGREMLVNPRALPGYLDILVQKNMFRIETVPTDFYDVAGQTLFPLYGQSGGIAASLVFYMIWQGQLAIVQGREGAYLSGVTSPNGLPQNF
jgi:hypothetical protein